MIAQVAAATAITLGLAFFVAGSVGLLRFPDLYNRLHAVTKADNVGLGLLTLGLALRMGSVWLALKLALIWLLVLLASTTACHLIARASLQGGLEPWRRE